MKILGIIPARGGSKGIPDKNIRLLDSKPLIQYTAEIALQSKLLEKVILSSESVKIIEAAKSVGIEVPFIRPEALSQDHTPTIEVVRHCLEFYKSQGIHYDAVCLLQVTSPFRKVAFLDEAIRTFIASGADSLVSVQQVPHEFNPHWVFEPDSENRLKIATGDSQIISRRQELPVAYHRDGSIYITKSDIIEDKNSLYGDSIAYIESEKEFHVNIDTMEDWEKAVQMAAKWNKKHEK